KVKEVVKSSPVLDKSASAILARRKAIQGDDEEMGPGIELDDVLPSPSTKNSTLARSTSAPTTAAEKQAILNKQSAAQAKMKAKAAATKARVEKNIKEAQEKLSVAKKTGTKTEIETAQKELLDAQNPLLSSIRAGKELKESAKQEVVKTPIKQEKASAISSNLKAKVQAKVSKGALKTAQDKLKEAKDAHDWEDSKESAAALKQAEAELELLKVQEAEQASASDAPPAGSQAADNIAESNVTIDDVTTEPVIDVNRESLMGL
ncbi:MAG: hypothetical protein P4L22_04155, partial [Candidatus Babeliales bacterium]|nr:hypothetical protein [Candidatus Babeliales bacterium]